MNSKLIQPWIVLERVEAAVQIEPALVVIGLALFSWIIYKLLLRDASASRHRNLQKLFLNLIAHLAIFATFFAIYAVLQRATESGATVSERMLSYIGLLAIIAGAIVFVKACRILLFEYLFLGHMKEGVPVLLVNIFTLILSIGIGAWIANEIFGIRLTPILATSAIFSLVLGLALQDTLGNLFAGVALQLDKPYEIGDWIEVLQSSGQKWVGKVHEITWRATTLIGLADEHLIIPNRVISQAEIANFTSSGAPIWRRHDFRLPFRADLLELRRTIREAMESVPTVRRSPEPLVNLVEVTESWVVARCAFAIDDYGKQWAIGTDVITAICKALDARDFPFPAARYELIPNGSGPGERTVVPFSAKT